MFANRAPTTLFTLAPHPLVLAEYFTMLVFGNSHDALALEGIAGQLLTICLMLAVVALVMAIALALFLCLPVPVRLECAILTVQLSASTPASLRVASREKGSC